MKSVIPKSILMVIQGLDPVGTGRQIEIVAEGFRHAGWTVQVAVTTSGGAVPLRLHGAGFVIHRLNGRTSVDLTAVRHLLRVVGAVRPAVIFCWGSSQAQAGVLAKAYCPGVRLISHFARPPKGLATAWALRLADCVIATSPGVQQACQRAGVAAGRLELIPPGIVAAADARLSRQQLAARLGLDANKKWTLCVAPLEARSRLDRLLWAIDQLGVVNRDLEHVLIGSGRLRLQLLRRARVQQLAERLHLVSECDCVEDLLSQVRLVWQSGDVAYGGAILDGMAHGVGAVAVASDAAGQLIVSEETGRIVAADPESEFPRRAMALLEDDALWARYGGAARARAIQNFSAADLVIRQIVAVERAMA